MLRTDRPHLNKDDESHRPGPAGPAPGSALHVRVRGTVQGVGFRPFIYRLAGSLNLAGWVRNAEDGVEIYVEGPAAGLNTFLERIEAEAPPAARIARIDASEAESESRVSAMDASEAESGARVEDPGDVWCRTGDEAEPRSPGGAGLFTIVESESGLRPTADMSPDLPVCDDCLREMSDPSNRRHGYPYINCTNCGPRYSIIERLPYDRRHTTMSTWEMCASCVKEYLNPLDRRYHTQPTACPACGPAYRLCTPDGATSAEGGDAIAALAAELRQGRICAAKGLGGYHLACDARNTEAVRALRRRKFRKEKPFAVMVRDLDTCRAIAELSNEAEALLTGSARPIVLLPAAGALDEVAPDHDEIGVMLPYAPLHVLLFEAGAPSVLVMTSANRSSEPIAYRDEDAFERLKEIADVFLVGERPIARRVDDSVARVGPQGAVVLRRSRGYAPAPVATFEAAPPILAVGADLKNAVTLVVDGRAYVSQHVGDLVHFDAFEAFRRSVEDLLEMYRVPRGDLIVAHDAHPQYVSTQAAGEMGGRLVAVQHHRAHVASVLAEHDEPATPVLGIALDGTGYGDDGAIWGGELFAGSLENGFERVAHLREAVLPGGDAAAEHPVQAAAGFLAGLDDLPDFQAAPFHFPERFRMARRLIASNVRTFRTTSVGRLFDTAAALLGFTRPVTFEGQAAMWVEHLARASSASRAYPFPDLDFRPLLQGLITDLLSGVAREDAALSFHLGLANGLAGTAEILCRERAIETVVVSGGVFQNRILLRSLSDALHERGFRVLMNRSVPPNDGGISLGQAALAAHQSTS